MGAITIQKVMFGLTYTPRKEHRPSHYPRLGLSIYRYPWHGRKTHLLLASPEKFGRVKGNTITELKDFLTGKNGINPIIADLNRDDFMSVESIQTLLVNAFSRKYRTQGKSLAARIRKIQSMGLQHHIKGVPHAELYTVYNPLEPGKSPARLTRQGAEQAVGPGREVSSTILGKDGKPNPNVVCPLGVAFRIQYWSRAPSDAFSTNQVSAKITDHIMSQMPGDKKSKYTDSSGQEKWVPLGKKVSSSRLPVQKTLSDRGFKAIEGHGKHITRPLPLTVYAHSAEQARDKIRKKLDGLKVTNRSIAAYKMETMWMAADEKVLPRRQVDKFIKDSVY